MRTVLITGNTSMLGRRLAKRLPGSFRVITAGRNQDADVFLDLGNDSPGFPDDLRSDILVHCASSFEDDTLDGAHKNEKINALGVFHVAELAAHVHCRHLNFISSISAYNQPENEYHGSYGISKSHGEDNLRLACRILGMHFTSLRVSQMYDEFGEAKRHQPFLYNLIDRAKTGQDITFYGKKDQVRNFLFVEDVVTVIEKVILNEVYGEYPVLFPVSYTLTQIAQTAFRVFGREGRILFDSEKPDIKSVFIPPLSDLYSRIDYTPQTDLLEGISLVRRFLTAD